MMGVIVPLLMAMVLIAAPPQADSLGSATGFPAEVPAAAEASPTPPGVAEQPSDGLPQRAAPPVTMRAQWPVFVLFALTWIGIVGYLVATGRRAARLADDLAAREVRR